MKNITRIISAILAIGAAAAIAQQAAPDKVALVKKGELKEARASWWGFNAEDSTAALVQAINSKAAKVIIDKMPSPWITSKTLDMPSNIEVVFEEGAELQAKRGCFKGLVECLVRISKVKNVTLRGEGKGAILRMHKKDYHNEAEYQKSEWRHAISLLSCENVNILNLTLLESGGDGLYLGVSTAKKAPTNIVIKDVIADAHNRQGISIIAGVNCLVENCQFINTWGTAPAAGVDFEPNAPGEQISGFVMKNCVCKNNQGCGFLFALPNMDATSGPLEITLDHCSSSHEGQNNLCFATRNGVGFDRPGHVIVKDCVFEDAPRPVEFNGSSVTGFKTVFENVVVRNVAVDSPKRAPINFGYMGRSEGTAGNIRLDNVSVYDSIDRPVFAFHNGGVEGGLENISGKITGYLNGKKHQEFVLSDEWAKKNFPIKKVRKIQHLDISKMAFQPLTPGATPANKTFSPINLRGKGTWDILAKKGDTLNIAIEYAQLAAYKGIKADIYLTMPSGKTVSLGNVPFKTTKSFEYAMPEDGLYKLCVAAYGNLGRIVSCNLPIAIRMSPNSPDFCAGTGFLYFYVPENTKEFAARFYGEGGEGLKVTIWGPDGNQVWAQDDISQVEQFIGEGDVAKKGGVYMVKIEKPTHLPVIEDHYMRLDGIPSFLSLDPNFLFKPAK